MNKKYTFRAKAGRDDLIIEWLDSIGESDKSYYIREALRGYLTSITPQDSSPSKLPSSGNHVKKMSIKEEQKTIAKTEDKLESSTTDLASNLRSWID